MYSKSHTPGTFYVLDTDATVGPMMMDEDNAIISDKLVVRSASHTDWPGISRHLAEFNEKAGAGDWVIIDMANRVWKAAQNYYCEKKYGTTEVAEHALETHASWSGDKGAGDIKGFNWSYVNALYDERMSPLLFQSPANIMCLSPAAEFNEKLQDDKIKRTLYSRIGHIPSGVQKDLDYSSDTILFVNKLQGQTVVTTVGERVKSRTHLNQAVLNEQSGFVFAYLLGVAGWKVTS